MESSKKQLSTQRRRLLKAGALVAGSAALG